MVYDRFKLISKLSSIFVVQLGISHLLFQVVNYLYLTCSLDALKWLIITHAKQNDKYPCLFYRIESYLLSHWQV